MYTLTEVSGHTGGECHLLMTEQTAVLIEAGYDFCAPKTLENIKKELAGRQLDAILLTHSHYDHAAGSPLVKRAYPHAKVVASGYAAKIFGKESARKVIAEMDGYAAKRAGVNEYESLVEELHVDMAVEDGDVFDIGDMRFSVHAAPGHTRCSVCYLYEQEKLFISCETLGICPTYPEILPCYVTGYKATMDSIEKLAKLSPAHVYVAHYGLIPDEGCGVYFRDCANAATAAKDVILAGFKAGKDLEGITRDCKADFYDGKVEPLQPIEAYIANAQVMIPRTLADYGFSLEDD